MFDHGGTKTWCEKRYSTTQPNGYTSSDKNTQAPEERYNDH